MMTESTHEDLICPICLEEFNNPKALPCIHTFCLKCLELHFKDKCIGDEVPCPCCREEFPIPPNGLGGLRHHFFVQHLIDSRNAASKSIDAIYCQACLDENEQNEGSYPAATVYCFDCRLHLCEKCSRPHLTKKMKGGAHQLGNVGPELEQELIRLQRSYCDKHTDEQLKLYCYVCNQNICTVCALTVDHSQHKSAEIQEAAERFSQQISSDAQEVWSQVLNIREISEKKEKRKNEFFEEVDKIKREIEIAGNQLHRIVDCQVSRVAALETIMIENEEKAHMVEKRYEFALSAMESFHEQSRTLLDKGRPSDITRDASTLHKRAIELLDSDVTSVQYCPPHVSFSPVDDTQLKDLNLIGKVEFPTEKPPGTKNFTSV